MMQAITQSKFGSSAVLEYTEQPKPNLEKGDILVKNFATGINPIDYKFRNGLQPNQPDPEQPLIIGWDGAGIVEAVGENVTNFKVGDEVYYTGHLGKNGTYAQYTAVDARTVAFKPKNIPFVEAASIPLVALTAWETFTVDFNVQKGKTMLVINGAGGLGSLAIQMAKHLGLVVITTASRPETIEFVKDLGADHVINHRETMAPQLKTIGFEGVDYIFHCHNQDLNFDECCKMLNPLGKIAVTFNVSNETMAKVDLADMWFKRQSIHHTLMFTRAMFNVEPEKDGELLTKVAKLFDEGALKTVVKQKFKWEKVVEAHAAIESGKTIGKIVLEINH